VEASHRAVSDYLGLTDDLDRPARLDLGGRVLGCHIEMTNTPGVDYPIRTTHQPDEPPLEMTVDQLRRIPRAAGEIGDRPGRYVYPEFVIEHERS